MITETQENLILAVMDELIEHGIDFLPLSDTPQAPCNGLMINAHSIDAARQLLAKAGLADQVELTNVTARLGWLRGKETN